MKRITFLLSLFVTLTPTIKAQGGQEPSEESPVNCTQYIQNPSFESGGTSKWTQSGLQEQTNSDFSKKNGTTYVEKWVSKGSQVGSASIAQTISIPMGRYRLTVGAQNLNQNNTSLKCNGAWVYAGDQSTTVYTPDDYSVDFTCISGEVEIGFKAQNATGNWLALDNFRLYQIGTIDTEMMMAEVNRVIGEAETLIDQPMAKTVAAELNNALAQLKTLTAASSQSDIQAAMKALLTAIEAARVSIADYAALQTAITAAEQAYDSSKEGAAEFLAAIDQAKQLMENGEAGSSEVAEAIALLQTAELLFRVANGSGTVPTVTTNKTFYIPAAHGALLRATFSGVSSFKERGFCWSNEPEPTIADHRSTFYYNQKGMLFHIKDMEPSSVYYVRPYAISNNYAVGYGEPMKIVTLPIGTCVGTWDEGAPSEAANARCRNAIQETMDYLNEWTAIKGFTLSGHYGANTPTADCSYGGWMRIGPNAGNQAIGTVIHETGHGVGVGTHWRWNNCADTRENTTYGKWLGAWANKTLRFLEGTTSLEVFMTGDGTHGWGSTATGSSQTISYDWFVNGADKDRHTAIQYIGGCALLYSLYIDGLCPTTGYSNGVPGYTFNFEEGKKYYIKSESADHGLYDGFVFERKGSQIRWGKFDTEELNDSAAWYVEYVPTTGYYRFRNAATGKYISHPANSNYPSLTAPSSPGVNQNFQLMPSRADVRVTSPGNPAFSAPSFWMTWADSGNNKALQMNNYAEVLGYGQLASSGFNYSSTAKTQHFIFVSEDDLEQFQQAATPNAVKQVANSAAAKSVVGIYSLGGVRLEQSGRGVSIIRYSDGSSKAVMQ